MAISPFSEISQFEQGNESDPFYATGSIASIGNDPRSFSAPLKNKEQIKLSFQVKNSVRMLATSASMYYFDFSNSQWSIPYGSLGDHTGPFDKVRYYRGFGSSGASVFIEDQIGFDCYGNPLISGSLNKLRPIPDPTYNSTSFDTLPLYSTPNGLFDSSTITDYMTKDYPKSVQRNSDYKATDSQTFSINNDRPFLLEKAVIEIPFCMGPGWFNDRSALTYARARDSDYLYYDGSYPPPSYLTYQLGVGMSFLDEGGPGITVSLFSQKKYGSSTIRDLIMSKLISPAGDAQGSSIETTRTYDDVRTFTTVVGAKNNTGSFGVEIVDSNSGYFTGSIVIKATSTISNGYKIAFSQTLNGSNDDAGLAFKNILSSERIQIKTVGNLYSPRISGIDAFGRGMTGFSPSGGSVFGKEYVTSQGVFDSNNAVKNPYYLTSSTEINNLVGLFTQSRTGVSDTTSTQSMVLFDINASDKKESPYLINPGEDLVLSVFKHRPVHKTFKSIVPQEVNPPLYYPDPNNPNGRGILVSSSYYSNIPYGHDVQLATGSINITLYGSYVRAGQEYVP